jgi:hypothetical protein
MIGSIPCGDPPFGHGLELSLNPKVHPEENE